jgi:hypothetical protein
MQQQDDGKKDFTAEPKPGAIKLEPKKAKPSISFVTTAKVGALAAKPTKK